MDVDLSHGELFIVVFSLCAVLLAPYSGRAGQWLASLLSSKESRKEQ